MSESSPVAERAGRRQHLLCLALALALQLSACSVSESGRATAETVRPPMTNDPYEPARAEMVRTQIEARGVTDPRVLNALRKIPRERFLEPAQAHLAYEDTPLPLIHGQTISQPFVVAYMSEAADIQPHERVLEIGTGSGYQAAILGELAREVYSIEIVPELAERATRVLEEMGYGNVHVRAGNGYLGWPEHAPFDAIVVTAAPERIPQPLLDQLAVGGRMVVPVGRAVQEMVIVERTPGGVTEQRTIPVRFVPMTGKPEVAP